MDGAVALKDSRHAEEIVELQATTESMRLSGRFLGIPLEVRSVVRERVVSLRKIGRRGVSRGCSSSAPYRMGFELAPGDAASSLRVFIDYARPARGMQRLLGALCARWCARSMARDAQRHFRRTSA